MARVAQTGRMLPELERRWGYAQSGAAPDGEPNWPGPSSDLARDRRPRRHRVQRNEVACLPRLHHASGKPHVLGAPEYLRAVEAYVSAAGI